VGAPKTGAHDFGGYPVRDRYVKGAILHAHPVFVERVEKLGTEVAHAYILHVGGLHSHTDGPNLDTVADHEVIVHLIVKLDHYVFNAAVLTDDRALRTFRVTRYHTGHIPYAGHGIECPLRACFVVGDAYCRLHMVTRHMHG